MVRTSSMVVAVAVAVATVAACGSSTKTGGGSSGGATAGGGAGAGGATASGGTSGAASTVSVGGSVGTGGSAISHGGASGSGSSDATGGVPGTGGTTNNGGSSSNGGSHASGGATASGGTKDTGGVTATGGMVAAGGTGGGSATAVAGAGSGGKNSGGDGGTGSGGSGGATSSVVTPTKVAAKYQLAFGDVVFEVDPQVGARVSRLSLAGTDLIIASGTDNTTWGSVFWTSPRSAWTPQTWPPVTAIDSATYTGGISGDALLFNGPTDSSMGIGITKEYRADAESGWITLAYTINATKAVKAGPWEDTRVPRGGIVFFPAGTSLTKGPLTMSTTAGINWFDDAPKSASSADGSKAMADGSGGWAAYAFDGVLFIKKFVDQPASAVAPSEGEVDIYPGSGFLEFEVLGPYSSIAAGANLPWSIQWRVVKIPSSVTVSVGSTSLVDFAKQQVGL